MLFRQRRSLYQGGKDFVAAGLIGFSLDTSGTGGGGAFWGKRIGNQLDEKTLEKSRQLNQDKLQSKEALRDLIASLVNETYDEVLTKPSENFGCIAKVTVEQAVQQQEKVEQLVAGQLDLDISLSEELALIHEQTLAYVEKVRKQREEDAIIMLLLD